MATTTAGTPYPALTDAPDVPYWMQQLAQAMDTRTVGKPRCKLVAAANQSVNSGSSTTVDFAGSTPVYDTNAMADIANDQIVVRTAGWYRISARTVWASNSSGYRSLVVQRNAAEFVVDDYRAAAPGQVTIATVTSEPILLAVNDTIRLLGVQTSGAALNLTSANGAARYSNLAVDWVSGQ